MDEEIVIKIDCMNDRPFVVAIAIALNLAEHAQRLAEANPGSFEALRTVELVSELQTWMENYETECTKG